MARDGLLVLVCALPLISSSASWAAPPGEDRDQVVAVTLAVQTAMQQGREHLLQKNPRAAVEVLESQLSRINGNAHYLLLLRDAYRAHIRELKLTNQDAAAQLYMQRLNILEPGAFPDVKPAVAAAPPAKAAPAAAPTKPTMPTVAELAASSGTPASAPPKPSAVRGKPEDDDPFQPSKSDLGRKATELVAQAEREFSLRRYRDAGLLYERAHHLDKESLTPSRERWAYCKLFHVVEQLNQTPTSATLAPSLETEVHHALELAPRLDYAKQLLCEIEKRRKSSKTAAPAAPAADKTQEIPITVSHGERNQEGWLVTETSNFRLYHNQSPEWAEQAARVAERTRTDMQKKWFGRNGPAWNPRCEIYLHATSADYSRSTGVPSNSPGHSSFKLEGARVVSRRIDLHCDDMNLLVAVLPHEATHTVLAGNFGEQPVPRWADEGMAVLSEPRDKVERHLRNLPQHRHANQLFSMRQLIQMNDYPEAAYVGSFYAQSVSLVDFLVKEKGAQVFTQFVREGMRGGYEQSLQQHYGFRSFDELEQHWMNFAFNNANRSPGIAAGAP